MFIRFDVIHERDRRTDSQTLHDSKDRAYASHRAVKTVTDDHAVYIAQSATHHRMFVCDGLQHGAIRRREENRKEFNCTQCYSEAEKTDNKRLRSTFCIEAI